MSDLISVSRSRPIFEGRPSQVSARGMPSLLLELTDPGLDALLALIGLDSHPVIGIKPALSPCCNQPLQDIPSLTRSLEGHALALELINPGLDALLAQIGLVVLIAGKANKLAIDNRLGLLVIVAISRDGADDFGSLGRKARRELLHGVAEVVAIAELVAKTKDRNLLAVHVHGLEVAVEEVVPGGARTLSVRTSLPRRSAADQAVIRLQRIGIAVRNVDEVKTELA